MWKSRIKFMAKVIGLAILVTSSVVAWGIVIAKQYGIADVPAILLSSVNAIAVVALSFFTYSYMKATEAMAAEMKTTRDMDLEFRHKPKIVVDFRISYSGMLYIEVANEGNGAARNISFRFEPELKSTHHGLKDFPALQKGIDYLAPKKRLTFFFDSSFEFFASDLARDFKVCSQYEWDVEGKPKIEEEYPLYLSPYTQTDLSSYKDESTLIDEVEKIRKALEKIQQASL
jgi:hypothetical protein